MGSGGGQKMVDDGRSTISRASNEATFKGLTLHAEYLRSPLQSRGHFPVLGCLLACLLARSLAGREATISIRLEIQLESPGSLAGGSIRNTRRNTQNTT